MFGVEATGHWDGDPAVACEQLTVTARDHASAKKLARLSRVLSDPDQRDRLLQLAERVEAESAEAVALVGN
jgi:gamma-glutamyl:cysteine ligase YbdK (ATP-grasp superfamily)